MRNGSARNAATASRPTSSCPTYQYAADTLAREYRCVSCRKNWAANHLRKLDHRNHRRDPCHRLQPATETRQVTRHRINIDLDNHHHEWLELTARIVGATKTEVARAMLTYTQHYDNYTNDEIKQYVEDYRQQANQARGRSQTARRHQQSTTQLPHATPQQQDS